MGENFSYEARSIHYNPKKKSRGIYGKATKEAILGADGIIAKLPKDSLIIDMSTIQDDEYLHTGIPLNKWFWNKPEDIACSAQAQFEYEVLQIFAEAKTGQ